MNSCPTKLRLYRECWRAVDSINFKHLANSKVSQNRSGVEICLIYIHVIIKDQLGLYRTCGLVCNLRPKHHATTAESDEEKQNSLSSSCRVSAIGLSLVPKY